MKYVEYKKKDPIFVGHGSIDGCYTDSEFWDAYLELKFKWPQHIGKLERIGKSYEGRHMHGFYVSENIESELDRKGTFSL
jgi:hypothetical protein